MATKRKQQMVNTNNKIYQSNITTNNKIYQYYDNVFSSFGPYIFDPFGRI